GFSCTAAVDCDPDPSDHFSAGWAAVRRDVAGAGATTDSARRAHRAGLLVGSAVQHSEHCQSVAVPTHRLVLVRPVTDRIWPRRWLRRVATGTRRDVAGH